MRRSQEADVRVHNAVISACRRSARWMEALKCFNDLRGDHNAVTLTTLLGALGDSGLWQDALSIFDRNLGGEMEADLYMCNTLMEAARSSGEWQWTMWLLNESWQRNMNTICKKM